MSIATALASLPDDTRVSVTLGGGDLLLGELREAILHAAAATDVERHVSTAQASDLFGMSEHTPGPWRYQEERSVAFGGRTETRYEVYTATGLYGHPATCAREEDARLIAAAPDLLAACEAVLWWQERVGGMCEPEDERDVLGPLRAAIAKACGKETP